MLTLKLTIENQYSHPLCRFDDAMQSAIISLESACGTIKALAYDNDFDQLRSICEALKIDLSSLWNHIRHLYDADKPIMIDLILVDDIGSVSSML
jgi:hypothetical protein